MSFRSAGAGFLARSSFNHRGNKADAFLIVGNLLIWRIFVRMVYRKRRSKQYNCPSFRAGFGKVANH